eukprot:2179452-Pyramimonas_sp.AAC.1
MPAARVERLLVFGFAVALLLAHAPAPRMPDCVEAVSPFCLQPLQVCYRCLVWGAPPSNAEGGARPAGAGVAAIVLV